MDNSKDQEIREKAKESVTKMNKVVNSAAEVVNDVAEDVITKTVEFGLDLKDKFDKMKQTKVKLVKEE